MLQVIYVLSGHSILAVDATSWVGMIETNCQPGELRLDRNCVLAGVSTSRRNAWSVSFDILPTKIEKITTSPNDATCLLTPMDILRIDSGSGRFGLDVVGSDVGVPDAMGVNRAVGVVAGAVDVGVGSVPPGVVVAGVVVAGIVPPGVVVAGRVPPGVVVAGVVPPGVVVAGRVPPGVSVAGKVPPGGSVPFGVTVAVVGSVPLGVAGSVLLPSLSVA